MKGDASNAVVFRTEDRKTLDVALRRCRGAGLACQARSASVWQFGMPRTVFEVSVTESDRKKANGLLAGLPQAMPDSGVTTVQRVWIAIALSVIAIVAAIRLARMLMGV